MAIIITKNGRDAKKVAQAQVPQEDYLQRYVSESPDSLPLDEIKDGAKLLVVGREFGTDSGPIDVLAVDGDGDVYIIETKLFKNPDKRLVVAQMLDYGAAMWKAYGTGDEFLADIEESLAASGGTGGLNQRLLTLYGLDDQGVEDVRDAIKRNLADGNIKFVVLMDRLHERLRDLILFINQKSRFNVYAVEMEFYLHEGMEIVIPKLFGAEVKKEVSRSGGGRRKRIGTVEEFLEAVERESDRAIYRKLLAFGDKLGAIRSFGSSAISIKLPDPKGGKQNVTLFVIDTYGEVYIGWTMQQLDALGLPTTMAVEYAKAVAALVPGVTPDPKHLDSLSRELTTEEVDRAFDRFTSTVSHFVQRIKEASGSR